MADEGTRPSYVNVDHKVEVMDTPYDRWIVSQGIDIVRGFFVEDLYTTPLKWWDRIGGNCIVDAAKLLAVGWRPITDTRAGLAATAQAA